jgi:hypothetical protein
VVPRARAGGVVSAKAGIETPPMISGTASMAEFLMKARRVVFVFVMCNFPRGGRVAGDPRCEGKCRDCVKFGKRELQKMRTLPHVLFSSIFLNAYFTGSSDR